MPYPLSFFFGSSGSVGGTCCSFRISQDDCHFFSYSETLLQLKRPMSGAVGYVHYPVTIQLGTWGCQHAARHQCTVPYMTGKRLYWTRFYRRSTRMRLTHPSVRPHV